MTELETGGVIEPPPDRARFLETQLIGVRKIRIRALGEIESADAKILARVVIVEVLDAKRLVARQRVVNQALDRPAVVRPLGQQDRLLPGHAGIRRNRRVELVSMASRNRERQLLRD